MSDRQRSGRNQDGLTVPEKLARVDELIGTDLGRLTSPTTFPPGSPEKLALMVERRKGQLPLFLDGDRGERLRCEEVRADK